MENQDHTCYCRPYNVSGSSTVTWQGQDSPTGDPELLRLRNVQRADNGTQYTCVVTADGVREEAVYTLRVGYGPFDDHMSVGPSYVVSNGSQPVTLTCNATNVYPTPRYTWRGVTCEKQSPPNTCTFTPDPVSDDLRNVTCTAVSRAARQYQYNLHYSDGTSSSASRTLELNFVCKCDMLITNTSFNKHMTCHCLTAASCIMIYAQYKPDWFSSAPHYTF
ncbi:uncharacterized protein [Littorina saxatilis]|uniref:uncharacterized protein n=1 Tax=Littorina saxatilis TaxID=31220 RepID=UPI0038B6AD96